jgi:hypothetical protein
MALGLVDLSTTLKKNKKHWTSGRVEPFFQWSQC